MVEVAKQNSMNRLGDQEKALLIGRADRFYGSLGISAPRKSRDLEVYALYNSNSGFFGKYNESVNGSKPAIYMVNNESDGKDFSIFVHEYGHHLQYLLNKIRRTPELNVPSSSDEAVYQITKCALKESFTYFCQAYSIAVDAGMPSFLMNDLVSAFASADDIKPESTLRWIESHKINKNAKSLKNQFNFGDFDLTSGYDFSMTAAKQAFSFAIIGFAMNRFDPGKTARFLFNPWDEVLRNMIRIAKSGKEEASLSAFRSMIRTEQGG